jgi:hypothetical protein
MTMKITPELDPESLVPGDTSDLAHTDSTSGESAAESTVTLEDITSTEIESSKGMDSSTAGASHAEEADEKSSDEPSAPANIDVLLAAAKKLYDGARRKEKALLTERIEIGGILIKLKAEVGHGNFIRRFREWVALEKLNFSLSIGDRAMAYAELADAGKLRTVRNLAEAERVRKDEVARKKAEKKAARAAEDGDAVETEQPPPAKLTKEQALRRAQFLAKPALDECRGYDVETRITVLEEIIEVLAAEHKKITKKLEP